jgi:hypothetical protein
LSAVHSVGRTVVGLTKDMLPSALSVLIDQNRALVFCFDAFS